VPVVVAGNGIAGDATDGTTAAQAQLRAPSGIALSSDGRIFVAEQLGHRVRVIETDGRLNTVAGGRRGGAGDGGPAELAGLDNPAGILIAGDVLYIADRLNHRVRALSLTTGVIETIAGSGAPGFAGDGGAAVLARLDRPDALAISADGLTMFVADHGNHRVRAVHLGTATIRTLAGNGSLDWNGQGHAGGDTSIDRPAGLAAGGTGFLFIADFGHSVIWRTIVRL
jgi:DNA-binding beta-propeller fold protein YncE